MKNITPNNHIVKYYFFALIALLTIVFTSRFMLIGVGIKASIHNIILLSILIIIFNSSKKAFWFITFPLALLYSLYSPIGLIFGLPNYQYIASIFATDLLESKEFLQQIPTINYIFPVGITFGILFFRYLTTKYSIHFYKNKTILCIFISISLINQPPLLFIKEITKSFLMVKNELVKLNYTKYNSTWGVSSLSDNSIYDNYILIIGESARKDYHHAYGYKINNTPFMSSSNGYLIDGLTSGGSNTVSSLRLMLTNPVKNKWEPDYSKSIIDLANSAGIETYWLSNQGYMGKYDTPVTAIAKNSQYKYFLKYKEYDSKNTSDFDLLPLVNDIINKNPSKKKLIILHLYGSHPNACDRINDYKLIEDIKDNRYNYINCYISSINKTDYFLEKLYNNMLHDVKINKTSFSMIYFSDHGLAHHDIDGIIYLNNNRESPFHFDIPLFKVSSDSIYRRECKSFKSGLNFTNGIANWIGINNEYIDPTYNLFDCVNDRYDYKLHNRIKNIASPDSTAIDIKNK